eukprot:TRINITY_DN3784_c0_g2_i1.p1 TRINITY_DN3784_c0_g2~~TRINITY_DN3784_c0_g2_i1.p1  ORF type:complete len:662 (+),score=58.05 TRINITY_DN3784_c0_g2_i1:98-1987(+)
MAARLHHQSARAANPFAEFVAMLPRTRTDRKNAKLLGRWHPAFGPDGDLMQLEDDIFDRQRCESETGSMKYCGFMFDDSRCIGNPQTTWCDELLTTPQPPIVHTFVEENETYSYEESRLPLVAEWKEGDCQCEPGAPRPAQPIRFWAYRYAGKDEFSVHGLKNTNVGDLRWATSTVADACDSKYIPTLYDDDFDPNDLYVHIAEVTVKSGFGKRGDSYAQCYSGRCSRFGYYDMKEGRPGDWEKVGWTVFDSTALWFSLHAGDAQQECGWSAELLTSISMADLCNGLREANDAVDYMHLSKEILHADYLTYLVQRNSKGTDAQDVPREQTDPQTYADFTAMLPRTRLNRQNSNDLGRWHAAFGPYGDLMQLEDDVIDLQRCTSGQHRYCGFLYDSNRCIGNPQTTWCDELPTTPQLPIVHTFVEDNETHSYEEHQLPLMAEWKEGDCQCEPGAPRPAQPIRFWAYRYAGKDDFSKYGLKNANVGDLRWALATIPDACNHKSLPIPAGDDIDLDETYLYIAEVTVYSGFGKQGASYGQCIGGKCPRLDYYDMKDERPGDWAKVGWTVFDETAIWISLHADDAEQESGWSALPLASVKLTDLCSGLRKESAVDSGIADYLLFVVQRDDKRS